MTEIVWRPGHDYLERANVTRFMRAHGIETYEELIGRSQDDIEWFWAAVVEDLGIEFFTPWERVLDTSGGIPWAKWFVGGTTNLAHNCVDKWAERTPDAVAVIWEGEDGAVRRVTYSELPGGERWSSLPINWAFWLLESSRSCAASRAVSSSR